MHGSGAAGVARVSAPLYRLKAEFFKTLGHPVRIRVLELLSEREHAVAEMLPEVGVEPAHLSQQLAVLRRANLVVARRDGATVHYSLVDRRSRTCSRSPARSSPACWPVRPNSSPTCGRRRPARATDPPARTARPAGRAGSRASRPALRKDVRPHYLALHGSW
ncbi:hypothetical protein GCM10019017_78080 [Streptomyces showdoensis]